MKNITDTAEIQAALEAFVPNSQGAEPTNRVLPGASSAFDPQEWLERGTINGEPAQVFYIFDEEEASSEDAEDYPWDEAHIDRIIIGEEA
jgi:hypothetical protein